MRTNFRKPSRALKVICAIPIAISLSVSSANAVVAGAVPGSTGAGFATPVVGTTAGGPLNFVNLDTEAHNFIAVNSYGPSSQPWCSGYAANKCPRFWSKTTTVGTEPVTPVLGMANTPGGTYAFHCTVHSGTMKGTLIVQ